MTGYRCSYQCGKVPLKRKDIEKPHFYFEGVSIRYGQQEFAVTRVTDISSSFEILESYIDNQGFFRKTEGFLTENDNEMLTLQSEESLNEVPSEMPTEEIIQTIPE